MTTRIELSGALFIVLMLSIYAQSWSYTRRTIEPRTGTGRSGVRWYEPWPRQDDFPDQVVWRVAALSRVGFLVFLAGFLAMTLSNLLRGSV